MVTFFTTPKPFRGRTALIQRNALRSWTLLRPACEIILFGNEDGTAEVAREFSVRHLPEVGLNERGTPLISDMFRKAGQTARYQLLCYANADVILMADFLKAVRTVQSLKQYFLMVGQRWNVDFPDSFDFTSGWEEKLRLHAQRKGHLCATAVIDYFAFSKGLWGEIPPFAIGRPFWDNWMLYGARAQGASLIDATAVITAVHQNHVGTTPTCCARFYGFADVTEVWRDEANRNRTLCGVSQRFDITDATHLLTSKGLTWNLKRSNLIRHLRTFALLHPHLGFPIRAARAASHFSSKARAGLGLLGIQPANVELPAESGPVSTITDPEK